MAISLTELNTLPTRADFKDLLDLMQMLKKENQELRRQVAELRGMFLDYTEGKLPQRNQASFSPPQFAKMLGRSRSWVAAKIEEMDIEAIQPGGPGTAWLIPATELHRWEEKLKGAAA